MIINHNMNAMNAYRMMSGNTAASGKSMEKLSSGLRINKAGDDAAGLAISEKMRGQIRGLDQASRNAQDGISMIQTAEGALSETHSILQRMRELATQAANDTNVAIDRESIQTEMDQLTSEINRIGNTTEFNTQKLLDGGAASNKTVLGSNEAVGEAGKGAKIMSTYAATALGTTVKAGIDGSIFVGGSHGVKFDLSDNGVNGTGSSGNTAMVIYNDSEHTAADLKTMLENLTDDSGLVKLGDLVNISVTDNGIVSMQTKEAGSNTSIVIGANASTSAGATTMKTLGLATTVAVTDIFTGVDGKEAKVEGSVLESTAFSATDMTKINADTAIGMKFDITLNGKTTTVAINASAINAANGLSGAGGGADIDGLAATLQFAIDNVKDADGNKVYEEGSTSVGVLENKVTVTVETNDAGDKYLSFKTAGDGIPTDGTSSTLKVSGDYANTFLGGITDGQDSSGGTFKATLQIGANEGQSFEVDIKDMRAKALGVSGDVSGASSGTDGATYTKTASVSNGTSNTNTEYALDLSDHTKASAAIKVIDNAINSVSSQRASIGAAQNRLEHTITNLGTSSENLTAAESRVRDVDMAKEMMTFSKNNILAQAAQAMLAQANQQPQGVLQLLR